MKNKFTLLALLSLMILIPQKQFAQMVNLGRAHSFALFTSIGAFNNVGNSVITGDIGTQAGGFTGFPPGIVYGQVHIADSVSLQVSNDVATAYAAITAYTCDSTLSVSMGNNQTLFPKVYCIGAITSINGNLILSGQNNPNAIFVFKIGAAFSMGANAKILLIDSLKSSNVFWQINGAVTLADSAIFRGNILANGAITLANKSAILGRGLSKTGAINITNTATTLPVKLLNFQAACLGQNILLQWQTASETNNDYFTISRSSDRENWVSIATLKGKVQSNSIQKYAFQDADLANGDRYYQLSQTDLDHKRTELGTLHVEACELIKNSISVYPNPSNGIMYLTSLDAGSPVLNATVYNVMGEMVNSHFNSKNELELNHFSPGIYYVNIRTADGSYTRKIVLEN